MNEFKQQVLNEINKHPGFTTNEYLADMLLDKSDKPKLARVLSELKKAGYVSSVVGEEKLLRWSLTPIGETYVAESSKELKFDAVPQADNNPDDDAVKDEVITTFTVLNQSNNELYEFDTVEEAIELSKAIGGGEVFELTKRKVARVKPIKTFEVVML